MMATFAVTNADTVTANEKEDLGRPDTAEVRDLLGHVVPVEGSAPVTTYFSFDASGVLIGEFTTYADALAAARARVAS
jgi:hypothetical protein